MSCCRDCATLLPNDTGGHGDDNALQLFPSRQYLHICIRDPTDRCIIRQHQDSATAKNATCCIASRWHDRISTPACCMSAHIRTDMSRRASAPSPHAISRQLRRSVCLAKLTVATMLTMGCRRTQRRDHVHQQQFPSITNVCMPPEASIAKVDQLCGSHSFALTQMQ